LVLLFDWIGFLEVGGESSQGGLGGGGRHARLEAANDEQVVGVAALEGALGLGLRTVRQEVEVTQRKIEFWTQQHHGPAEIFRRDADDRERALVDADGPANEVRIETGFFPVEVAGDDHRHGAAGFFLLGQKAAALHERHPERAEIVRADDSREGAAGGLALADAHHGQSMGQDPGKDGLLLADVLIGRVGELAEALGVPGILSVELDDLRLVRIRARAENQLANDTEDGRVSPDPESENGNGGGGEAGGLGEQSE